VSRLLSSNLTYVYKVIVPGLGITALVAAGAISLGFGLGPFTFDMASAPLGVQLFVLMIVGVAVYQIRLCLALKRIEMDGRNLYVSNYRKQVVIPLREVATVTENRWVRMHPVTIHLLQTTEFGNSIVFVPDMSGTWLSFLPHPIVNELQQAIARAKGTPPD